MKNKIIVNSSHFDRWLFVFWILFFMPPCIERVSRIIKITWMLLQLGVFFLIFIKNYKKRIRLSRFSTILSILLIWCMLCIVCNGASLTSYIKNVFLPVAEMIFVMNVITEKKKPLLLKMLYYVSTIYIILNFSSMLLFPNGLFVSDVGSSVARVQWILGSKNNVPNYILIFMNVVMAYDDKSKEQIWVKWILLFMSIFSIFFSGEKGIEFMGGSSTGIIAVLVCMIGYMIHFWFKKLIPVVTMKNALIVMGLSNVFILTGPSIGFINDIVTNIFHKSMTFSGRTAIWEAAILKIMQSPFMGSNSITLEAPVYTAGQLTTTNYTYNVILQYLLSYGIVSVILIVLAIFSLQKARCRNSIMFVMGFAGMLVIGMMNEIGLENLMIFPILLDCFSTKKMEDEQQLAPSFWYF